MYNGLVSFQAVIQSLETEKSSVDRGFESRGKELHAVKEELEKLKQQHQNLEGRLERAHCVISHHLPFVDSGWCVVLRKMKLK